MSNTRQHFSMSVFVFLCLVQKYFLLYLLSHFFLVLLQLVQYRNVFNHHSALRSSS